MNKEQLEANRRSWNHRVGIHQESSFYQLDEFIKGKTSLNEIDLQILGNIKGKQILHPMCHFGMDSLSMVRMGAEVSGFDLSDKAVEKANELGKKLKLNASFVACDYYDFPKHIHQKFDLIYLSYGVIGWLPDLTKWAKLAYDALKLNGELILIEFHPFVWMYDDDFKNIQYNYFNDGVIHTQEASYTEKDSTDKQAFYSWNHSLSEVLTSLINAGFSISKFEEYDYSPYDCFKNTYEFENGKFRIKTFQDRAPLVYALVASKN